MGFKESFLFLVLIYFGGAASQDCREYSQTCEDEKDCCGGCCLRGVCRDMYEDCRLLGHDPCLDVYCPPNEECYVFQAQDCGGCGPTTDCRTVHMGPSQGLTNTEVKMVKSGSGGIIKIYPIYMFLIFFLYLILSIKHVYI